MIFVEINNTNGNSQIFSSKDYYIFPKFLPNRSNLASGKLPISVGIPPLRLLLPVENIIDR